MNKIINKEKLKDIVSEMVVNELSLINENKSTNSNVLDFILGGSVSTEYKNFIKKYISTKTFSELKDFYKVVLKMKNPNQHIQTAFSEVKLIIEPKLAIDYLSSVCDKIESFKGVESVSKEKNGIVIAYTDIVTANSYVEKAIHKRVYKLLARSGFKYSFKTFDSSMYPTAASIIIEVK